MNKTKEVFLWGVAFLLYGACLYIFALEMSKACHELYTPLPPKVQASTLESKTKTPLRSQSQAPPLGPEAQAIDAKVQKLYFKLWKQTGVSEKFIPLEIEHANFMLDSPFPHGPIGEIHSHNEFNAFTNAKKIRLCDSAIYQVKTEDELALLLGHEIGHVIMGSVYIDNITTPVSREDEAMADKLGAIYMMKAGFDVCKGRELIKLWQNEMGNGLNEDHPDFSYRYNELNVGCVKQEQE